jgi:nucleoside-diphosphate-sugar epimerase
VLILCVLLAGLTQVITHRNFNFSDVHAKGAARIARVAAQAGVSRLVHVSHLNASHDSKSKFLRSKAEGEELVREAFPNATIIRPGSMFGSEDKLLTNMACMFCFCNLVPPLTCHSLANVVAVERWGDQDASCPCTWHSRLPLASD